MKPSEVASLFARRNPWAKGALLRLMPNHVRTIQIAGIGPFRIRNRDHRCYWLRDPLEHDRLFLGGIANLLRQGMNIWDVGGHIGLYTRMFAQVLKARRVVTFEPDPRNRELLAKNIQIGSLGDQVRVVPYALCDRNGTLSFFADHYSSHRGHIAHVKGESERSLTAKLRVEGRTIDSLIRDEGMEPPQFIKIDVESAEARVLQGGRECLRKHSPLLAIELHGLDIRLAVFDELESSGYVMYGYRTKTWRQLTRGDFEKPTTVCDPRHVYAARESARLRKPARFIDL